ncbi:MAG: serine/threonine protein kinase, partial [Thermoleophilia bacterium]|nr:serine/threonine protein kinase [Thermoleophilia bacterium]
MGTVYRATHIVLDHMVALKVIAPDLADDDSFRERFKSESRIAVSLRHPNVVPIHHAGEEQGLLFVTMDLIDGPDLRKLLTARGPLEPAEAISILEQVAAALDVAHSRGLVHRDIKPGNILIEARTGVDHAYLTDFGLTKRMDQATEVSALTSTGAFVGTLDYVAPEQIRGERLDARTDVYALGCVLYEMLAAAAPFAEREEKVAKIYAHLQDVPTPLEGRAAALNDVITRAMSKEPDDRYPSAGDLARAADAALAGGRVAEAERSVATGPAAPTMAYEMLGRTGEEAPPIEPTAESKLPPVSDPGPAASSETSEAP